MRLVSYVQYHIKYISDCIYQFILCSSLCLQSILSLPVLTSSALILNNSTLYLSYLGSHTFSISQFLTQKLQCTLKNQSESGSMLSAQSLLQNFCHFLSLCPSPTCALSLSLSKINKHFKKLVRMQLFNTSVSTWTI